jgi:hypothetical protein
MRKVLQTHGALIAAFVPFQRFVLERQGTPFELKRVFFRFENPSAGNGTWYFSLIVKNGEGAEKARISSTESEDPSAPLIAIDGGSMHFFGEVEFRSHVDGASITGFGGVEQAMSAPLGCDGLRVDTNDTVEIVFRATDPAGLSTALDLKTIYWHCDFDSEKKV